MLFRSQRGVRAVDGFIPVWDAARPWLKDGFYEPVAAKLKVQAKDARWWRDACLLYFSTFSRMPLPEGVEVPEHSLSDYMRVKLPIDNYTCPSDSLLDCYR